MRWKFVAVFLFALAVNFGLGFKMGMTRPMESDSYYFWELARSMADGDGYRVRDGFWPDAPSMSRLPGWPFLVSVALKMFGDSDPHAVMRATALLVNAFASLSVCILAYLLFRGRAIGVVSGLAYVLHPGALFFAYSGLSEPLFVFLVATGISLCLWAWAVLRERLAGALQGMSCVALGAVLLGYACLVRVNFLLWGFILLGWWIFLIASKSAAGRNSFAPIVLSALLFLAPACFWAMRNYAVCGRFPVFSTLEGQTFYGGNNSIVAEDLEQWGYWVFPDQIPGEKKMREMATAMSELDVSDYYVNKGKCFLRQNWFSLPRLWLGKLTRAYVPVPWKPVLGSYLVSAYRWILYAGVAIGLLLCWREVYVPYRVSLAAMAITSVATVLVFWGCARFAFVFEPFFMPLFGAGIVHIASHCRHGITRAR